MSGDYRAGLAWLALLAAGWAQAAEPAAAKGPVMRSVTTPAGLMLVLEQPSPPPATASKTATDVVPTPAGPMLVLRDPMASRAATANSARSSLAAPASSWPATARAEALPNGAQMLVLPANEPPKAPEASPAIVEIDPAKPGTRIGDLPRNDVLYRPPPPVTAATKR